MLGIFCRGVVKVVSAVEKEEWIIIKIRKKGREYLQGDNRLLMRFHNDGTKLGGGIKTGPTPISYQHSNQHIKNAWNKIGIATRQP